MRLLSALLSSALAARLALAVPNYGVSKTSLSIDRHREALDNGEILVRVQRTDDLFTDPTAHEAAKLLVEKHTHIALRIQLDPETGSINVNDQPLDLQPAFQEPKVTAIKAEAFRLPNDHDSPVADADTMLGLLAQMSPGIVAVEVKVEQEAIAPRVPIAAALDADTDAKDSRPSIEALTIRKVGLWIRVIEVEGQEVPRTTTTYTPILQLIVTGSGNKVNKIETISIDGSQPLADAAASLPGPVLPFLEPARSPEKLPGRPAASKGDKPHEREDQRHPHGEGRRPHRGEADKAHPQGWLAWLASKLGLQGHPSMSAFRKAVKGCKGKFRDVEDDVNKAVRVFGGPEVARKHGKHLESHRVMVENPFSGLTEEIEIHGEIDPEITEHDSAGNAKAPSRPDRIGKYMAYRHGQHRHHGWSGKHPRHSRCGRFFRRMLIGLSYGFHMIVATVLHPITLMAISGVAASALLFHIVRRFVVKKRRHGALRLEDDDDDDDGTSTSGRTESLFDVKEKEAGVLDSVVVVDDDKRHSGELPRYAEKL